MDESQIQRIRELCSPLVPRPADIRARLEPLSGIRAVLFDIYGTLFISGSGDIGAGAAMDEPEALRASLEYSGFSVLSPKAGRLGSSILIEKIRQYHLEKKLAGVEYPEIEIRRILADTLKSLVLKGEIAGEINRTQVEKTALDYECRVNPTWPMPELSRTIEGIFQRKCILGLVSNAQFYTPLLFPAFLGRSYQQLGFDERACIWSYLELEAKPSLLLFRRALTELNRSYGIAAGQVLYVGNDLLNDIWPAAQTGCKTALFAGDSRSLRLREGDARCKNLKPDLVLTSLSQILTVL